MNEDIRSTLIVVLSAVYHLGLRGCTVRRVEVGDRRPVITIDPPGDAWIHGAMRRRETVNGATRTVMAASFHGCNVEWTVTEYRGKEALHA